MQGQEGSPEQAVAEARLEDEEESSGWSRVGAEHPIGMSASNRHIILGHGKTV